VRRFIRTLSAGDTSCAAQIAEVRVVDRFPRRARDATPADGTGSLRARRIAAVAAATVADTIQRWALNYSGGGRGLRGGRWNYTGTRLVRFRLHATRLARDVPVTGTATWRLSTGAVRARLRVPGGRLRARWNLRRPLAVATLHGRGLRATMPAP
jgi:hypothetical protein